MAAQWAIFDRGLGVHGGEIGDFHRVDLRGKSVEAIATAYARLRSTPVLLLADHITTRAQLLVALDLGFDLLRGQFVEIAAISIAKVTAPRREGTTFRELARWYVRC